MVAQKKNVSKNINKNESTIVDINPITEEVSSVVDVTPTITVAPFESATPITEIISEIVTPIVVQKAGAKKANKNVVKATELSALVTETPVLNGEPVGIVEAVGTNTKIKKVKAVAIPKVNKKLKKPKVEIDADTDAVENAEPHDSENDSKTRSFKVQLPDEQEYTGRFTGLTPYQAANKALSKFFRNSDNTNISTEHIVFSIKESSRGSKRSTYTYKGTRIKLEKAITYTIKSAAGEERIITKQYKNQLIKIKKGVLAQTQEVAIASA